MLGHSDADVLLHAIMDALLGAAALGDIGKLFPDSDEAYKGADSLLLTKKVATVLRENGYEIENVDSTVIAQAPKLAPHIEIMRKKFDGISISRTEKPLTESTARINVTDFNETHTICLYSSKKTDKSIAENFAEFLKKTY